MASDLSPLEVELTHTHTHTHTSGYLVLPCDSLLGDVCVALIISPDCRGITAHECPTISKKLDLPSVKPYNIIYTYIDLKT